MALAFQDFFPRPAAHGAKLLQAEALATVVDRANQWLAVGGFRAINMETLLLPSSKKAPPNSSLTGLVERWDEDHVWVQVVRVWYEVPPAPAKTPPPSAENSSGSSLS